MKQYLVIGLGSFGTNVARTLYEAGEEVVGIDLDETIVQETINNDYLENALVLDATDEIQLKKLDVQSFDVVFICIGLIEPSIMITLNLKEMGVKKTIVKAINGKHRKLLEKIGADQVIYPEEYMGKRTALVAMEPNMIEHLRFSQDFLLVEVKAPLEFIGKNFIELDIRKNYNINVIGIKKISGRFIPNPTATTIIEKDDTLIVVTDTKSANKINDILKKEYKED
ncbi:potassium channel family protein [Fusobacterium perfoetens]|uniref:potassium channel family protein n=1 Tax=Fusobacterium perfoetens TaxID=852 RepID=UPI000489A5DD|nr:TrkA family potassium uptake protein [Fusobacterium perfoetens]MCI6153419.1 TrkA family potassium uptake protein [Fusobacterium perfoetens]MDY3238438.1 TrkA family potassium uptake protein [Fusobacterium perfoetens]